jgi:L-fuculose-phosphate aldolase
MQELKLKIVETGKKLSERGFSPGFSGNISARFEDKFLITPSGLSLGELTPNDIVIVDEFANKVEGRKNLHPRAKCTLFITKNVLK